MKNIHLLTTENPSRLILQGTELLLSKYMEVNEGFSEFNQYLYITNDEEIKVGDWCIYHSGEVIQYLVKVNTDNLKKIILTTDQDLIADGIQAIDDEFLQWFVKNPTCEEVYTTDDYEQVNQDNLITRGSTNVFHKYKIIIPKEEPKQEWDYLEGFINQFIGEEAELSNDDWTASDFLEWLKLNKFKIVKIN
jgi:hypothetical protein